MSNPLDNYVEDKSLDRPMITAREWEDGVTSAIRTIGKNMNLDVIFAGEQACTDGNLVILPKNDDGKLLTKRQVGVGRGFSYHEALHNVMTDFKNCTPELARLKQEGQHLAEAFCQAVEDVRIEHGGTRLYAGMQGSLDQTAEWAAKHYLDNAYRNDPDMSKEFKRIGPIALTWAGRKRIGYSSPLIDAALGTLPDEMLTTINKWVDAVMGLETGVTGVGRINRRKTLKGCRDGMTLAKMLATEAIEEDRSRPDREEPNQQANQKGPAQNDEQVKTSEKGEGGEKPEPTERESGLSSKAQGSEAEKEDSQAAGSEKEKPEDAGQEGSKSGSQHVGGPPESQSAPPSEAELGVKPANPNLNQAVADLMAEHHGGGSSLGGHRVLTRADDFAFTARSVHRDTDGEQHRMPAMITQDHNSVIYRELMLECGSRVGTMRRKLERALAARENDDYEGGKRRGKLSRRAPSAIIQGKRNIYKQKQPCDGLNTALAILVDCSHSMKEKRMRVAAQAMVALAEVLDPMDIAFEVSGFAAQRHISKKMNALHRRGNIGYVRIGPTDLYVLKSFDERLRQCRTTMGGVMEACSGLTPDGPAILMQWDRLKLRPEKRKVMLVLTDGEPKWRGDFGCPQQQQFTRDAIQYCINEGCEMIGLGIMHDGPRHLYPKYAIVHDIDDVAKNIMDQVATTLLGDDFHIDNGDLLVSSDRRSVKSVA